MHPSIFSIAPTTVVVPLGYPVRRKYPKAASERLTITSDLIMEEPCEDHKGDSVGEKHKDVSTCSKRLLPDRTHAAHNRANEKLVNFIVKQHMVDKRLLVGFLLLLLMRIVFPHIPHPFYIWKTSPHEGCRPLVPVLSEPVINKSWFSWGAAVY